MHRVTRIRARLRRISDSVRPTLRRENVARFLIAVALAFALWAWVEATNDPETQRTIANIPVTPENVPETLVVTSELPTVTVRLQGAQSAVQAFESGSIRATVDLSDVQEPGIYTRRVQVRLPGSLRLREVIPAEVTVQVDRLVERTQLPIEAVIANGLPPNVEIVTTRTDPATATIRGPQQRVNAVVRVSAPVKVTEQSETIREVVSLVPVDETGLPVQGVTVEPSTATVTIQLRIRGQVRRVIPTIVGADRLPPGYELAGPPTVFPSDEVVVEGPEAALAAIPYLTTTPIDISGWSESRIIWEVPIDTSRLPAGVRVDPSTVNVSIQIRRAEETRVLRGVPVVPVNVRVGTTVELSPSNVDVEVSGPTTVLDRLATADILVFVDLENADAGIYQLPVRVSPPPGVRFERVTPEVIQVTVVSTPPPAPTPTPSP